LIEQPEMSSASRSLSAERTPNEVEQSLKFLPGESNRVRDIQRPSLLDHRGDGEKGFFGEYGVVFLLTLDQLPLSLRLATAFGSLNKCLETHWSGISREFRDKWGIPERLVIPE
jgi:hypothetical protein